MHTLTSVSCPNRYVDPGSPDPVGASNLAIGTIEEMLFGPDDITLGKGRCVFDTYPTNGGTAHPKPGEGALVGPGYESVDTSSLGPGTYRFYCQVHAFMRGTLVVKR
jgi:plastocyanin